MGKKIKRKVYERVSAESVQIALHYCYSNQPFCRERGDAGSEHTYQTLLTEGILEQEGATYRITTKGRAWVDEICRTPYPVAFWIDPRTSQPIIGF